MSSIWHRSGDDWQALTPTGFANEEKLHDLVETNPNILPLAGDPSLTVLGREVRLASGRADLLAIEPDGRLVILEIKLQRNAEARRAVVAQVLTYAAYLKGTGVTEVEKLLEPHLLQRESRSILEAVRRSDQASELDEGALQAGLAATLADGSFRLVLVLDDAPSELVELTGYLESIAPSIQIDLVTVSAYDIGSEQVMVPQRVDPQRVPEQQAVPGRAAPPSSSPGRREVDGSDAFESAIDGVPEAEQPDLRRLLAWARDLEAGGLARLRTVFGDGREVLVVWVRGEKGGLASVWNEGGASITLWRSVFVRLAWDHIATIEKLTGQAVGQGTSIGAPDDAVLDALTVAYEAASAKGPPTWNGHDYYVAFGDGPTRNWEEAKRWGFVAAGGGAWYSRTLQQLRPGNRVFVYVPRGSGIGGYVGVGTVQSEAMLAKDFEVSTGEGQRPYLAVTQSALAADHADDAALAEWIVPVEWIRAVDRPDAVMDSDFFANQNSAVKMTHGYTLQRLKQVWDLSD